MNTHHHYAGADHGRHTHLGPGTTAIDPVCGMQVNPDRTAHHAEHEGVTHPFLLGAVAWQRVRGTGSRAKYLTPQVRR
ncbi:hypothetical protein [Rhodanobacter lindaniclasticus]